MARPQFEPVMSTGVRRKQRISVLLYPEEKRELDRIASKLNMTLSDFTRLCWREWVERQRDG